MRPIAKAKGGTQIPVFLCHRLVVKVGGSFHLQSIDFKIYHNAMKWNW